MSTQNKAAETRKTGTALLIVGFLGVGVTLALVQWEIVNQAQRDGTLYIGLGGGGLAILFGLLALYDSKPIPNTPVAAPTPLVLTKTEPWRQDLSLRFLQPVRAQVLEHERELAEQQQQAEAAYAELPEARDSGSYMKYRNLLSTIRRVEMQKQEVLTRILPPLKQRLDRVYAGDIQADVLDLEEAIRKNQRYKEDLQRQLTEAQDCRSGQNGTRCEKCVERLRSLPEDIQRIDFKIIEYETHLKDLRAFNYAKFHAAAGMPGPASIYHVDTNDLQNHQQKVSIINSTPNLNDRTPKPKPDPTAEKQRRKEACEKEIVQLRQQRTQLTQTITDPQQRRQMENIIDDAIQRKIEEWSRCL